MTDKKTPQDIQTSQANHDPMHGVTLEMLLTQLVDGLGWEALGQLIRINCFRSDPSIKSSLKFLRRTPWARDQVETVYLGWLANESKEQLSQRIKQLVTQSGKAKTANQTSTTAPKKADPWAKARRV